VPGKIFCKSGEFLLAKNSVCLKWAEIRKELEKDRLVIEQGDCWIAASALKYDCALATNNARHFTPIRNLLLICPSLS
jgi:predicted nucleic acid-binding protein